MNEKEIKNILQLICSRIKGKQLIWRLEGSANLLIQGVDVNVRDLDITTDCKGIKIFNDALKEFIKKDYYNEKLNGNSLVCKIFENEVEINSYGDEKLNMFDKIQIKSWQGMRLPILPLKHAKTFYQLINRKEKVDLISMYVPAL